MADETSEQPKETPRERRRFFTRRRVLAVAVVLSVSIVLLTILSIVLYRGGVFDTYIQARFRDRMAEMGIVFDAERFQVTASPLALELRNATFTDKLTGEKLFSIREAHLAMTVQDLYSLQLRRDISIDTTEIAGAEVWVKFDENGKSNWSNLKFVEEQPGAAVNFRYESLKFALTDSVIHLGDLSRKISGNANNVMFDLEPDVAVPAGETAARRYRFDVTSTDSNFTYDEKSVEKIDIRAKGVADNTGADISSLDLTTPIGTSTLSGRLTDWEHPKYDLDIQTSVDMTQASSIFLPATPITGVGNFKGKVSGEGETYHIEGEADSEALRAGGVYLKAINVNATVAGINNSYEANGRAVAEMLTFEDFRIDWLKMAGNVRGTGTDFNWLGDLQAAAASSKSVTLGGLFLDDARAEYKDRQLRASAPNGRAQKFGVGDLEFAELQARNLKASLAGNNFDLSAPSGNARQLKSKSYSLQNLSGNNIHVRDVHNGSTNVDIDGLRSDSGLIKDSKLKGITADRFHLTDLPHSTTSLTAKNVKVVEVDIDGTKVMGLEAPDIDLSTEPGSAPVIVYADKARVAKIDSSSAILGSLNIGGVRLTIAQGRVEVRSKDIDAGNVTLKKTSSMPNGGTLEAVKIVRPVYILEPSGRYRASADMSIGGGALGSVSLGAATAKVDINNDRAAINDITASVMNGSLTGTAVMATSNRGQSSLKGDFSNLDLSKLIAIGGATVNPFEGQATGHLDLTFNGSNFRTATGTVSANITASPGDATRVPVNGEVRLSAANGLFNVDLADLHTDKSRLSATGRFDTRSNDSNLALTLRSTDASEIDRLVRVIGFSPELQHQLDSMQVQFAGNLNFDGTISGNFTDPTIIGKAALDALSMRGRTLGSVTADINSSPLGLDLANGKLLQPDGGRALFTINVPYTGKNNIAVKATLTNVNAGNLLAALPVELPERIRDLSGQTSGSVDISGLPSDAKGSVDLAAATGTIAGQAFDNLNVKAVFTGTLINLERAEVRLGAGKLSVSGTYDRSSTNFDLDLSGQTVPAPLLVALFPKNDSIPPITGDVNFTAKASGTYDRTSTYLVNFNGTAPNVQVGDSVLGQVAFKGQTVGQVLTADLTATLDGRPQVINASVNFGNENLPFTASTDFDQSPLAPFIAFIPQLKGIPITGTGTGRVEFGGNLSSIDANGNRVTSAANLSGTAQFSQLALQIQDTPLAAAEPVMIRFNPREIVFEKARFAGGGSNMTIAGTKALTADGVNNLSIDGRVNLNLLNLASKDVFFAGFADTSVRLLGPNSTARLSGTATIVNGSVATFLGSDRFTVDRLKARIIFTTNQVEVEEATGYLGGGKFRGSGGGILDGLAVQAFRFSLDGDNVTVPLPTDFVTTGDAQLEFTGRREQPSAPLQMTIGGRVFARRSLYNKDIDLANVFGVRREPVLSTPGGLMLPPRFDLTIEGRDALVVKNNIADLTASVSLVLTGDADNPRLSGRISATGGTIFFRKDRYEVQRGILEFPPETAVEPVVNLQAETEIAGYQIFVNLSGPLRETEELNVTVRSSPALPQADVVSLITTGSLSNTEGGIPTLAQAGIRSAAEVLTDTIVNAPVRKATDKLFGLNVFEIDPIISGQNLANPGARLTVGRQINNKLRVTYSTNLSGDQNQLLSFEYRVSNKLSFVAQYEQRPLSNVTRNRDVFSFEVRFRKRF
jgi:translocation and assembly module TamB